MQRNIPSYQAIRSQFRHMLTLNRHMSMYSHSTRPILSPYPISIDIYNQPKRHTRIPCTTIGTSIIARHGLDQFLKSPLIPRLMALAQSGGHVVV